MKKKLKLEDVFIVGGPTVGKTWLLERAPENSRFDTDWLMENGGPFSSWLDDKLFADYSHRAMHSAASAYKDFGSACVVNRLLTKRNVIVTNLWGPTFINILWHKPKHAFFRDTVEDFMHEWTQRGQHPIDEKVAKKWVDDTHKYAPSVFGEKNVTFLKAGDYIGNYFEAGDVKPVSKKEKLSDISKLGTYNFWD